MEWKEETAFYRSSFKIMVNWLISKEVQLAQIMKNMFYFGEKKITSWFKFILA